MLTEMSLCVCVQHCDSTPDDVNNFTIMKAVNMLVCLHETIGVEEIDKKVDFEFKFKKHETTLH